MGPPQVYDPSRQIITVGSLTMTGFGPDTFLKIAYKSDLVTQQVGAGGDSALSISADRSATIEFTLMQTSPSNTLLSALANSTRAKTIAGVPLFIVPFLMKDASDTITAASAAAVWVSKFPDMERAKETGQVTWMLETNSLEMTLGGAAL